VSAATQQTLLDALIRLAKTGPAIVVTTTDRIPVMEADVVIDLTPADGPAVWQIGPGLPGTGQSRMPLHAGPPGVEQPQLEAGAPAAETSGDDSYDHTDPPTQVIDMPDPGLPAVGDPAAYPPKAGWSSPQWPSAGPSNADWPDFEPPSAEPPSAESPSAEPPSAEPPSAEPPSAGSPNADPSTEDPR
jgi:hypothetical protein